MDATAVLALVAVITAGQVASLAILATRFQKLATLATRSAAASTPQDYLMLERAATAKRSGKTSKPDATYPIGL